MVRCGYGTVDKPRLRVVPSYNPIRERSQPETCVGKVFHSRSVPMKAFIGSAALGLALALGGFAGLGSRADDPPGSDAAADAEERKQKQAAERFLAVLEKNPRRGTALDKLYGYHVEAGTLESFVKAFRDRAHESPTDGVAWMLLGLIESQRGRDAAAVEAFRR